MSKKQQEVHLVTDCSCDVPKYWDQYLRYIDRKLDEHAVDVELYRQSKIKEFEAKPLLARMLTFGYAPEGPWFEMDVVSYDMSTMPEREPTMIGYYNWYTNVKVKADEE